MAQTPISSIKLPAREALFKQASGAAIATTRAAVHITQMRLDAEQRQPTPAHIKTIRLAMEEEGVNKGHVIHGYIDVDDPDWHRSEADTIKMMDEIQSRNKLDGHGSVHVGILPPDVKIQISNGNHRLHAYCRYLAEHWESCIPNPNAPLKEDDPRLNDKPFAQDLVKKPEYILAQDIAWWLVIIEYIRKYLLVPS